MRMKLFFSGRPSAVKYSALPLRSKRKPVWVFLPVVKVAARILPVPIRSPSRQVSSTTALKRSPGCTSLKSMSYLKISSVITAMAAGLSPALRPAAYSELSISALVTASRVVVARSSTFSWILSPSRASSTRWVGPRSKRKPRSCRSPSMRKPNSVPGRRRVSASRLAGVSRIRCRVADGTPMSSNTSPRVCPDSTWTTSQNAPASRSADLMVSGGNCSGKVALACEAGCNCAEKPGTMVASSTPRVRNRLACSQCWRVQRVLKAAGKRSFNLRCRVRW